MSAFPAQIPGNFQRTSPAFPPNYGYPDHFQGAMTSNASAPSPMKPFDPQMAGYANFAPMMQIPNQDPSSFNGQNCAYPPYSTPQTSMASQKSMPVPPRMGMAMNGFDRQVMMPSQMQQTPVSGAPMMMADMKSPHAGPGSMPGNGVPQMQPHCSDNSGMFTAPHPRQNQKTSTSGNPTPSPVNMAHHQMIHPHHTPPTSSSSNSSTPTTPRPPPPSNDTPFTVVTHYDMPPAFQQYQNEFKRYVPSLATYYDKARSLIQISYPPGQTTAPPVEPPTFGFLPGHKYYDEKFDRSKVQQLPMHHMQSVPMQQLHHPPVQQQQQPPPPQTKAQKAAAKKRANSAAAAAAAAMEQQANQNQYNPAMSTTNTLPANHPAMYNKGMPMAAPHMRYAPMGGPIDHSQIQFDGRGPHQMMAQPPNHLNGMQMQLPNGMTPNQMQSYGQRPTQNVITIHCGVCKTPVTAQNSIQCNGNCRRYFHHNCTGMSDHLRSLLESDSTVKWACDHCGGVPQVSHSGM